MSWSVVTINAPDRMGKENWVRYHKNNVRPVADVVLAQESPNGGNTGIEDNKNWFAAAYNPKDTSWRQFRGDGGADGQPIFLKTSVWEKINFRVVQATPKTTVLERGAGGNVMREKNVIILTAKHKKTGKVCNFINLHAVPSIQYPERDVLHERHMDKLAEVVRGLPGCVVVGGDFNCEWSHPNMNPVQATGLKLANPNGATHGSRQIDLLLMRSAKDGSPKLVREKGLLLPKAAKDDHKGVLVRWHFQGEAITQPDPDSGDDDDEVVIDPDPPPPPPETDPEVDCGCGQKDC